MQKAVRMNESQFLYLASKARQQRTHSSYLYKKSLDTNKWQLRWFQLFQNFLFYYENDTSPRPSGVALLEGCYCERLIMTCAGKSGKEGEKQYCFAIHYRKEGQRQYELRAETEVECNAWIRAIEVASFSKILEQKEQLEQKHLHLLQILDSERQAKWHYVQQTEEFSAEVKKLKNELKEYRRDRQNQPEEVEEESSELRKIKKVQSFFRGWLCRRRWKQIVDEYIRSDHAESMRKRNKIVFQMVESEEEYVKQLSVLVSVFLRPLRMAASSKKPPITHEDVNSIFLNSETLLFLHQIFVKGLVARMENWPTLVLGDLFDMLLPMLGIYQEYVRNHHYSLQVLSECKQRAEFNQLISRYEEKSLCEGRTLETFLTYPMHQIPRYIIAIHELLAHTPHDHIERKSLQFAQSQLEELSQIMHDEVSETENIRKNLAIERMIVEGCDILLDVTQTFVRQGALIQVVCDKPKGGRGRLGSFGSTFKDTKKEMVRQVFLFTNHMLMTTRSSNGRLHFIKQNGKIPLANCTLVEDCSSDTFFFDDDMASVESYPIAPSTGQPTNSLSVQLPPLDKEPRCDYNGLDFRLIVDIQGGPPICITLVAALVAEKAAWCSDLSQCIENIHYTCLLNSSMSDTSSVTMPQSVRSDPKLFRDDDDIKFSRTLNSCKVPHIRHATVDRLLSRLTDLRFLSIDFLNTFLLTYRVFTTAHNVLESLKRVYRNPECGTLDSTLNLEMGEAAESGGDAAAAAAAAETAGAAETGDATGADGQHKDSFDGEASSSSPPLSPPPLVAPPGVLFSGQPPHDGAHLVKPQAEKLRRISTGSMPAGRTMTGECSQLVGRHSSFTKYERRRPVAKNNHKMAPAVSVHLTAATCSNSLSVPPAKSKLAPIASCETLCDGRTTDDAAPDGRHKMVTFEGGEELTGETSTDASPPPATPPERHHSLEDTASTVTLAEMTSVLSHSTDTLVPAAPLTINDPKRASPLLDALALSPATSPRFRHGGGGGEEGGRGREETPAGKVLRPAPAAISYSFSSPNIITALNKTRSGKRGSAESDCSFSSFSTRSSFTVAAETGSTSAKVGAVVTSSRASKRRSSSTAAAAAFAAATAASTNPKNHPKGISRYHSAGAGDLKAPNVGKKRESVINTAATMRVLNVLRHWVSKHTQHFESEPTLKAAVRDLLEEMVCNTALVPAEHKAAASVLRVLTSTDDDTPKKVDLDLLLTPPTVRCKDTFDTLSALDIAEQLTYLDHQIFKSIRGEELLSQAWMKANKAGKAAHVLLVSQRFNEVSRLVVSEVVQRQQLQERVSCIEKWAAIADICRCMHNYNGVLQICAAFVNSSVYRLRRTWEKLSKQTKQMIDKLQVLVSSDGRFKNMRDALHRCNPPCIPYLGMYLTDLSFIEEGTPNLTDEHLVNFSKMRMVAHVIHEIQHFQQTNYRIEHHKRVTAYLLDPSRILDEDQTYRVSLDMEPRTGRASIALLNG